MNIVDDIACSLSCSTDRSPAPSRHRPRATGRAAAVRPCESSTRTRSRGELEALRRLGSVADGGLEARPGRVGREELARLGLSKREIDELLAKLASSPGDEEFDLDLSAARPAEHFAREMEAAVPRVDRR